MLYAVGFTGMRPVAEFADFDRADDYAHNMAQNITGLARVEVIDLRTARAVRLYSPKDTQP